MKDDTAIENQRRELLLSAHEHGYENALIYIDNGESGNTFDRPGLNAMKAEIKRGELEAVFVWNISRIGRGFLKTDMFITWLREQGVVMFSATEGKLTEGFNNSMQHLLNAAMNAN
ncbi:recombinase family protein [Eubacteriales bacterium OttesenSCG-928-G02]|nr:recombinase family protein [Eubacteriales bacterium OttesenSCG-928-G02]